MPLVILALTGCGKSNSMTYQSGTAGASTTRQVTQTTSGQSGVSKPVSGPAAWEVRNAKAWRYIVIHHSASEKGNAATFHTAHLANGWDGLGYHFVITNGNGGPDGAVEVGYRWTQQRTGAHTGKTPANEYNEYGIGICLVGNFNNRPPSRAQIENLNRLICYLQDKYRIPTSRVIGHSEAPNAATDCPGHEFMSYLKSSYRPYLAKR